MTLLEEIQNGETETLEFKREIPSKDSKLMKTVVAFSNCHGGRILFGVDDETHEIVGIENEKVFKYMDSLADMISESVEPQVIPRITFETIEDKTVVVVQIVAGQNQPYFLKSEGMNDGVYIRVAATTRKAEREKVKELMLWGEGKSYDKIFENHEPVTEESALHLCKAIEKLNGKNHVTLENLKSWGLIKEENGKLLPSIASDFWKQVTFILRRFSVEYFGEQIKYFLLTERNILVQFMNRLKMPTILLCSI